MPHTLLLRLPTAGEPDTEWLSIDEVGNPTTSKQRGPLALAAAIARTARVVVLAPATQILLAEPELPPGSGVKLARAVPFALEEQLTEDSDRLVFALGRRRASGGTPVAVVSRDVMQGWLDQLQAAGIEPSALYPDMSLLPHNPGQTVLWLEKARLSVRRPDRAPFAVELTPVTEALVVAGVIADPLEPTLEPRPLESAILYVTREDWEMVQDEFDGLIDKFAYLKIQLLNEGPLPWLAKDLASTDAINLLQGEFARRSEYGLKWRRWRLPAALAAGLLAVHVGAQALQIREARKQSVALDAEIAQLYAASVPNEPMREPRRQMQTLLDRIRHSGPSQENFLRSMQVLSGALSEIPKASVDTLSFREQTLELKVTAPSLADLSQLSQTVAKQGMSAEIQSSTPVGTGVEAHLQLRTAPPAKAPR